ncbi:MAG: alanine racemase [Planctomycetes bacterium]|nr:alanine racemase [Planctomycetota bacterium]
MKLRELRTPAALVELDVVARNCRRMGERVARLGAKLRPHVKTHKTVEAARLSVQGHFGGVTVSTLAEARALVDAGFRELVWAVPVALDKLSDVAALAARVESFGVLVDHPRTAAELAGAAKSLGVSLEVWLKVDCGYHRAGVDPKARESVELARALANSPGLRLRGVLTHAGHAYDARSLDELRAIARSERELTVAFAERLRGAGVPIADVSIGSTPTLSVADDLTGVTEVRPGNYVFFDAFQAALGSCTLADAAFSVLASVLGAHPARRELVLDAGALALSKDTGARHVDPRCGYGRVTELDGTLRPELELVSLSQEHGKVRVTGDVDWSRLAPGAKLRVIANHSCLAAAQFERYAVVRGDEVVDEWRPARGW